MKYYFLPDMGNFYKANLHCHSNISDGKFSPEELKKIYREHGYDILAITDHDAIFSHNDLNDENFLTITSYEMEINYMPPGRDNYDFVQTCHLNFYARDPENVKQVCYNPDFNHPNFGWCKNEEMRNKRQFCGEPYQPQYIPECINHIIDMANKNGFIVTLNHLKWSKEPYENFSKYKGMFAMEIFNTDCYANGIDEVNGTLYDEMLRLGNKLYCVAADDNHNHRPLDDPRSGSFGGYVMIKSESLTYDKIFSALEKGDFYSSCGPEIKALYLENGKIFIETGNVKSIRFLTDNRYADLLIAKDGENLNRASFKANRIHEYFRIEVEDFSGRKAFTNAYFKTDFEKHI